MALYWSTLHFYVGLCVYVSFACRYVVPPVSVITTLYYVAMIFYRRVWYCALSLRYACIRSSGIIVPSVCLSICLSGTGMHCNHTAHIG